MATLIFGTPDDEYPPSLLTWQLMVLGAPCHHIYHRTLTKFIEKTIPSDDPIYAHIFKASLLNFLNTFKWLIFYIEEVLCCLNHIDSFQK